MPIDVTKYGNSLSTKETGPEDEDPKKERDAVDDEESAHDKEAVEDEDPVTDKSDSVPESGCEDSGEPSTRCSKSGFSEQDTPAERESSMPDGTKVDEEDPGLDLERLLIDTGSQQVGRLMNETGGARTTFRLSTEAQTLFDRLSGRTGKSKKELLKSVLRLNLEGWAGNREAFAETAKSLQVENAERVSMAIAPRTRMGLNNLRDETGIDRDRLVEVGIRLFQAALRRETERKITPHRDVRSDLVALRRDTEEVQRKLSEHPSRSDGRTALYEHRGPVERGLFRILHMLSEMEDAIEKEEESGEPMGEYREFP